MTSDPPGVADDFTLGQLLDRGWTSGKIARFLGEPDRCKPARYGGELKLWDAGRVVAAEAVLEDQYTLRDLKVRGWAGELIGQLLEPPDEVSEAGVKYWSGARVREAEALAAFGAASPGPPAIAGLPPRTNPVAAYGIEHLACCDYHGLPGCGAQPGEPCKAARPGWVCRARYVRAQQEMQQRGIQA